MRLCGRASKQTVLGCLSPPHRMAANYDAATAGQGGMLPMHPALAGSTAFTMRMGGEAWKNRYREKRQALKGAPIS